MVRSFLRALGGAGLMLLGAAAPALAHPHIFIDAKVAIGFDSSGRIASLKHTWTFDPAFSAWAVQGLDTNHDGTVSTEEMQPLADDNMSGLSQYGFYTYAGDGMSFSPVGDQKMVYVDGKVTLSYSITANTPQVPGHDFELGVYDPEYYVAISFADVSAVTLENAPADCSVRLDPPEPMSDALQQRLSSLGPEVLELPPDLAAAMRGTQGKIVVSCGDAPAPQTALEAVNAAAKPKATPFGGPPPEASLNLPRTGFFGWLQQQQREFYAAMTKALDALHTDWTAFWVLGGLSFVYGILHAAGPGHGKVVISSYMLASERQLRRGVMLSAASALVQSLVAIGFVLVLAGILNLTSAALGEATRWVEIISYAMVTLLGTWLVLRKIFGWGAHKHDDCAPPPPKRKRDLAVAAHRHLHGAEVAETDMQEYGDLRLGGDGRGHPDHLHEEHMHHAIGPADIRSDWREQLGVVLAVGMRPCSGALVVLVFALSQGVLLAGILSVLLMGAGTAITVAALATLAVLAKGIASRMGGSNSRFAGVLVWWAELLGAALVLMFGVLLLIASL